MAKKLTSRERQMKLAKRRHQVELRKKRKMKGQTGQASSLDYNQEYTPNIEAMFKRGKK